MGAAGSLCKDIVNDGRLVLPKKDKDELILGFIGGVVIGGLTGIVLDNSPVTAFLAGYAGTQGIESLLLKGTTVQNTTLGVNEQIIRRIATEQGVDPELAVRVAKCESSLNHRAVNKNADGSTDRGLFQINSKYHPEISDEQAFNPITATEFFCKAFKAGNLSWWNATKTCWDK